MPYTALQTLGWLATHSKWERAYNVNRMFLRHSTMHQRRPCGLVVGRAKVKARARGRGKRWDLVVVFKTTVSRSLGGTVQAECCKRQKEAIPAEKKAEWFARGHLGCGMLECRVCGVFWKMYCEEVEALSHQGDRDREAEKVTTVESGHDGDGQDVHGEGNY